MQKIPSIRLIKALLKSCHVEVAFVFGSFARGDVRQHSDIDIAVLLSRNLSKTKRFDVRLELAEKISRLCKRECDLIILNDVPSLLFKFIIVTDGEMIYRKDELTHASYVSQVLAEYNDFRPFLEQYERAYVAKNS